MYRRQLDTGALQEGGRGPAGGREGAGGSERGRGQAGVRQRLPSLTSAQASLPLFQHTHGLSLRESGGPGIEGVLN